MPQALHSVSISVGGNVSFLFFVAGFAEVLLCNLPIEPPFGPTRHCEVFTVRHQPHSLRVSETGRVGGVGTRGSGTHVGSGEQVAALSSDRGGEGGRRSGGRLGMGQALEDERARGGRAAAPPDCAGADKAEQGGRRSKRCGAGGVSASSSEGGVARPYALSASAAQGGGARCHPGAAAGYMVCGAW